MSIGGNSNSNNSAMGSPHSLNNFNGIVAHLTKVQFVIKRKVPDITRNLGDGKLVFES